MQTLLQIVNAAQAELGLPLSATVVGNSDLTTAQLSALANRCIDEIRRMNRWTACQFEYNLVVNPAVTLTGNISSGNLAQITGLSSTSGLSANFWAVSGPNVAQAARIQSVDSSTQVTMDMQATGPSTGGQFVFAQDTYSIPSDFDFFNNRTMWDRTNRWELLGPDSPQMDQWHRSGIVATGPRRHFRKIGPFANTFRLWPAPVEIVSPLQLVFEYLSLNCVQQNSPTITYSQRFLNDTDTPLLDDQSIIIGIKWMFWRVKGFGYVDEKNDWIDYVNRQIGRDGGAKTLQLHKKVNPIFISPANVQDGFFPGPVGPNMG